jgi:drug/metabolite transporter (DMT)-like permease
MLLGLGAALAAAVVFGAATMTQAIGARRVPRMRGLDVRMLLRLLREPVFVVAVLLNFAGFGLHLVALRLLPLYLAQAGIAASLVVAAALAVRTFGDRLSTLEWASVAAVSVGIALLTTAAGEVGTDRADLTFSIALFVVIGVLAGLGALVSRLHHRVVPALLGLLAGLAFATDSVAVRVLPDLTPGALWHAAPTYAFLASAALAFLLYSMALQRGAVAAATAPLIVAQTLAPAVVGVTLLGDGVRSGYLPLAVVGLALTTLGAARLARFEGSPQPAPQRD